MPKPKDPDRGSLRVAVLHVLAHGDLPVERVPGEGRIAAFEFKHHCGRPEVVAELRRLWLEHRAEIFEAAGGRVPWVQRVVEAPEDEEETTTDDEKEGER